MPRRMVHGFSVVVAVLYLAMSVTPASGQTLDEAMDSLRQYVSAPDADRGVAGDSVLSEVTLPTELDASDFDSLPGSSKGLNSQGTQRGTFPVENAPTLEPASQLSGDRPTEPLATQRPSSIMEALARRGTVSFRKTPLQEVVFLLSDLWDVNIVAGETVTGDVSGTFDDAPLREVLSAVLKSSGYGYTASGQSLVILPAEQVGTNSPEFVTQRMVISNGMEDQMESLINASKVLMSEQGAIEQIGPRMLLVVDTPDHVERVASLFSPLSAAGTQGDAAMDVEGRSNANSTESVAVARDTPQVVYFTPQYTDAEAMIEALQGILDETTAVALFSAENRILVRGSQEQLNLASEAIEQLDQPRAQVRITAMIYDVGLRELERLGVNWGRNFRVSSTDGTPLSGVTTNFKEAFNFSTLGTDGATSLAIRTLSNNFDTSLLLEALESANESKLLADPSITVSDRREASISIVQRIPVIAADPVQGSNAVFAQVEFEDAGVILNVTPRISVDGTIELNVKPEYSVVTDFIDNNPVIDSRTAETTVRVANGQTFVLGGLRQKTLTKVVRGVPYLRDMRLIGKLFRNRESEVRESELIVFLKPEIVGPCHCGKPRERVAESVSTYELDAITYATQCSLIPVDHDPCCPSERSRYRVNNGSHELRMMGECGLSPMMVNGDPVMMPGMTEVHDGLLEAP
ncbi:MAG: secretin N-terminal domain-containing protein [Planctomycetota bacterium]